MQHQPKPRGLTENWPIPTDPIRALRGTDKKTINRESRELEEGASVMLGRHSTRPLWGLIWLCEMLRTHSRLRHLSQWAIESDMNILQTNFSFCVDASSTQDASNFSCLPFTISFAFSNSSSFADFFCFFCVCSTLPRYLSLISHCSASMHLSTINFLLLWSSLELWLFGFFHKSL